MDPNQYFDLNLFASCPPAYSPRRFFTRYQRSIVPPYFSSIADRLTRQTGVDFVRLWGWESARLMEAHGLRETVGDVGNYTYFSGNSLIGATSRTGDVYRTAFLRTVAWFRHAALIDENEYVEYSLKLCPVDPSLWEIEPLPQPDWWPRATASSSDIETLPEWEQCLALVDKEIEGSRLFAAEGAVIPSAERKLTLTEFVLLPFGYSVQGPDLPGPEAVFSDLDRCVWQKHPESLRPLVLFDGDEIRDWVPIHDLKKSIGDLCVHFLLGVVWPLNINHLQPWRGYHRMFFPSASLAQPGGRASKDEAGWSYQVRNKKLFWGHDWKLGALERTNEREYMLRGQYALVDPTWLTSFLESEGLRLGHVLRLSLKHRKYDHETPRVFDSFRLLNVSPVIL